MNLQWIKVKIANDPADSQLVFVRVEELSFTNLMLSFSFALSQ